MNRHPVPRTKNVADMVRSGTYRKDRHGRQRTPTAPPGHPSKPESLNPVAAEAWDAVVAALDALGTLATVDGLAIYQYACLYAETEGIGGQQIRYRATAKELETTVSSLTGADLAIVAAQLGRLAKLDAKCTDQLRNGHVALRLYLTELGLTPASRNRIRLPEAAPDTADPFLVLAARRPSA